MCVCMCARRGVRGKADVALNPDVRQILYGLGSACVNSALFCLGLRGKYVEKEREGKNGSY